MHHLSRSERTSNHSLRKHEHNGNHLSVRLFFHTLALSVFIPAVPPTFLDSHDVRFPVYLTLLSVAVVFISAVFDDFAVVLEVICVSVSELRVSEDEFSQQVPVRQLLALLLDHGRGETMKTEFEFLFTARKERLLIFTDTRSLGNESGRVILARAPHHSLHRLVLRSSLASLLLLLMSSITT